MFSLKKNNTKSVEMLLFSKNQNKNNQIFEEKKNVLNTNEINVEIENKKLNIETIDSDSDSTPMKYLFLNDDELNKLEPTIENIENYTIVLCLYKINEDLDIPFLEYFLIKSENQYTLPQMNYSDFINQIQTNDVATVSEKETEEPTTDNFVHFANKYINIQFDILKSNYKGYIDYQDKYLIGFIEMTEEIEDIVIDKTKYEENNHVLAILDEIVFKQTVFVVPVEDFVSNLFLEYPVVSLIKDEDGISISIPYLLYICKEENNDLYNLYFENDTKKDSINFLYNPTIENDIFISSYMFSRNPIKIENINKIKRYSVFIENPVYIPAFDMSEYNDSKPLFHGDDDDDDDDINYSFQFNFGETEMWSINNIRQFILL
jgi:hypothetical protein